MTASDIEQAFRQHRALLVALSYRLTGNIDDAEEVVQETFARALERATGPSGPPLRPWLIRVATNISLDALRRRRRRAYPGPWLPAPLAPTEREALWGRAPGAPEGGLDPAAVYELRESATLAFLVALETLSPRQRAALVLKEVFELSAREIGSVLGVSEGGARMLLHRARGTLGPPERKRGRSLRSLEADSHRVLARLLDCLRRSDLEGVAGLLSEDARLRTDSGGEVTALAEPLVGARRVARLLVRVAARRLPGSNAELICVNSLPALWIEFARTERRQAPRALLACELDPRGSIVELFGIVNPRKLARVR